MGKLQKIANFIETPSAVKAYFQWPLFSLASYNISRRLRRIGIDPKTIIDVGSNIGQFAVASSKIFEGVRLICIEPNQFLIEKLKKNLSYVSKLDVINCAVGEARGMTTFYINQDSQVSSILKLGNDRLRMFPSSMPKKELVINIDTLDNIIDSMDGLGKVLLKLDVQGVEAAVLKGAEKTLQRVEWVVIEIAFANLYCGESTFGDIDEIMKYSGFVFLSPLNFHMSPNSDQIIEMDALYVRKNNSR